MSENSFDDDDFDDILGSDIDGFISKDDKKNDLGELNHVSFHLCSLIFLYNLYIIRLLTINIK